MLTICSVDVEFFRSIGMELIESEVIITEEQRKHSKKHEAENGKTFFEQLEKYIPQVLLDSDCILEDAEPNTVICLRKIEGDKWLYVVLRFVSIADPAGYKNSVISFWRIGKKGMNDT